MKARHGSEAEAGVGRIDWRTLVLLLIATILVQATVPMARIGTTYRALEHQISPSSIAVISAGFALFPILLAVFIGRHNDGGAERQFFFLGTIALLAATLGLWNFPVSFMSLFGLTCALGIAQLLMMASLQTMLMRCCNIARIDTVLGHFMVATSLGQVLGPLIIVAVTDGKGDYPGPALLAICVGGAAVVVAVGGVLFGLARGEVSQSTELTIPVSLLQLLRANGLIWIILASSLCVTTSDLILIYFPILCAERGVDVGTMGLLLSLRAAVAMTSRIFYSRLVAQFGCAPTMVAAILIASVAILSFVFALPPVGIAIAMGLSGFGLGIALTASSRSRSRRRPPNCGPRPCRCG